MADPKQLASLLSEEEELRRFNAAQGGQPWYSKALPMEGRATLLPFRDTMEGSVFNKRELALPGILAGAVNAFTSPARAFTGSDPTFKPGEEAANMALNTFGGGIATGKALANPTGLGGKDLALNVYHGTPHEIKGKLSLDKIGTGEGNQSYGYGIYSAENPEVGKHFMTAGTSVKAPDRATEFIIRAKEATSSDVAAKEFLQNRLNSASNEFKPFLQEALQKFDSYKGGNLYKLDIPDEQIPKMLDWDNSINKTLVKPIRKLLMSDKIEQRALDDFGVTTKKELADLLLKDNPTGQQLYDNLIYVFRTDKAASGALAEFGIPGMKYLDEGSRAAGKGTSNFVSYQPETIKILEKNNVPVTRKELLQQEFDKLEK